MADRKRDENSAKHDDDDAVEDLPVTEADTKAVTGGHGTNGPMG